MRALLLLFALLAAGPLAAQTQEPTPEMAVLDQMAAKRKQVRPEPPAAVAQAISLAFGTTFFNEVHVSTSGPVVDLSRLSREGFYKRELIQLLLMSKRSGKPLAALAERRRKGDRLRDMAVANGVDYDKLYDASLAVEEIVDRQYLPRFKERPPRKERDEPW